MSTAPYGAEFPPGTPAPCESFIKRKKNPLPKDQHDSCHMAGLIAGGVFGRKMVVDERKSPALPSLNHPVDGSEIRNIAMIRID